MQKWILGLVTYLFFVEIAAARSQSVFNENPGNFSQQVVVNIPAYQLILYTWEGNTWKALTIPIGVGRGIEVSDETPTGEGYLYAKATGVVFRYGDQNPEDLAGKVIKYSYTFSKKTLKPIKIPMPKDMKSVFMAILSDETQTVQERYVLHQTTDWYTIGIPSSNGCIRIDEEDMQSFYTGLAPDIQSGRFFLPVPISIRYEMVVYDKHQEAFTLHANIYRKSLDYFEEILEILYQQSIDLGTIDVPRLRERIAEAEAQFRIAEKHIRKKLSQPPSRRLILDKEKQQLHYSIFLSDILM